MFRFHENSFYNQMIIIPDVIFKKPEEILPRIILPLLKKDVTAMAPESCVHFDGQLPSR